MHVSELNLFARELMRIVREEFEFCVKSLIADKDRQPYLLEEVYVAAADTKSPDGHTNMARSHRLWQCMFFIPQVIDSVQYCCRISKCRSLNRCRLNKTCQTSLPDNLLKPSFNAADMAKLHS